MFSRSTIFLGLMLTGSLALASFVREDAPADAEVVAPITRGTAVSVSQPDLPTLQLERLSRSAAVEPESNPFSNKSWFVPPPLPPVIPALQEEVSKPVAPNLPFVYMGRIQEEGERAVVFLTQGQVALSVSVGEVINGAYRLESVSPTQLVFHYIPLNTTQTMTVGNDLSDMDDSMASAKDALPDAMPPQSSGNEP